MNRITQNDKILHWFETHETITPLDAMNAHRIMRLAARIRDLEAMGYRFSHETVWMKDERGMKIGHYTAYRRLDNGRAVHQAV
jgi:hypothetical protein